MGCTSASSLGLDPAILAGNAPAIFADF